MAAIARSDAGGELELDPEAELEPDAEREFKFELDIADPKLWSPDSPFLYDLKVELQRDGERVPREILRTEADELRQRLSPDGRWLAFQELGESGTTQVFVQPYPGPGEKRQISFDGGESPVWAKDGSALYFVQGSRILVSRIETSPRFGSTRPEVFLDDPSLAPLTVTHAGNFEAMPDGRLLIMLRESVTPGYLNVVRNFFKEVKERVPTGR